MNEWHLPKTTSLCDIRHIARFVLATPQMDGLSWDSVPNIYGHSWRRPVTESFVASQCAMDDKRRNLALWEQRLAEIVSVAPLPDVRLRRHQRPTGKRSQTGNPDWRGCSPTIAERQRLMSPAVKHQPGQEQQCREGQGCRLLTSEGQNVSNQTMQKAATHLPHWSALSPPPSRRSAILA